MDNQWASSLPLIKVDEEGNERKEIGGVSYELTYEVVRHLPLDMSYIEFGHDNG